MRALNCPHCAATDAHLVVVERHGIEIDYCPRCRGIWLERGELEKIFEREARVGATPGGDDRRADRPRDRDDDDDDRARGRDRERRDWRGGDDRREGGQWSRDGERRRPRREGILGELFDF
ncbi:MAG: zf-TFIIB domain-containing protein [Alphaproteobacteria bacterium]